MQRLLRKIEFLTDIYCVKEKYGDCPLMILPTVIVHTGPITCKDVKPAIKLGVHSVLRADFIGSESNPFGPIFLDANAYLRASKIFTITTPILDDGAIISGDVYIVGKDGDSSLWP